MAETNELTIQENAPEKRQIAITHKGVQVVTLDDLWRMAKYIHASGLATKGDTVEAIFIKAEMGLELGMPIMQAIQNIAVINGRAAIWGDAVPGLCRGSGMCEYIKVDEIGKPYEKDYGYRVTTKRAGDDNIYTYTFTVDDAERAGLWNKSGPWKQYPKRMLMNRARTFALRDAFPDVLKGISTTEEEKDIYTPEYEVVDDGKTHTERLADKAAAIAKAVDVTQPQPAQEPDEVPEQNSETPLDDSAAEIANDEQAADNQVSDLFDGYETDAPQIH